MNIVQLSDQAADRLKLAPEGTAVVMHLTMNEFRMLRGIAAHYCRCMAGAPVPDDESTTLAREIRDYGQATRAEVLGPEFAKLCDQVQELRRARAECERLLRHVMAEPETLLHERPSWPLYANAANKLSALRDALEAREGEHS